jgi:acetyl-CoA acetyltransferase
MTHVAHAHAALQLGLCNVAVIAYGSTQRSVSRAAASPREFNPYESPYRPFMPSTAYAMAAARHMHQHGTTREQPRKWCIQRKWALMNPCYGKEPLTIEQVLNARMVLSAHGARLLPGARRWRRDCMTRADHAVAEKETSGCAGYRESLSHANISSMPDFTVTAAKESGAQASPWPA